MPWYRTPAAMFAAGVLVTLLLALIVWSVVGSDDTDSTTHHHADPDRPDVGDHYTANCCAGYRDGDDHRNQHRDSAADHLRRADVSRAVHHYKHRHEHHHQHDDEHHDLTVTEPPPGGYSVIGSGLAEKYSVTYGTPDWLDDVVRRYGLSPTTH